MPVISTHDLTRVIESGAFERLIVRRIHSDWYLLAIDPAGETLIHADEKGRHKLYRHSWQVTDWLRDAFDITDAEVEPAPQRRRNT